MISIFGSDGSVQLTHGGIECGQGIHTVAVQVLAYSLKIPLEIISVKHAESFLNANGADTGGSTTTELVCLVIEFCFDFYIQLTSIIIGDRTLRL
jgi:xanthine dehydrogenase/oxidase